MEPLLGNGDSSSSKGLVFGGKTIGFYGGIFLLINNNLGTSVVIWPALVQMSGLMPTLLVTLAVTVGSLFSLYMLVEAVSRIPRNSDFQLRVEYMDVSKNYFNPREFALTQCIFFLYMTSQLVANIIQTSQVADFGIVAMFGNSCGLQFFPFGWKCAHDPESATPFGDAFVLSAGLVLVACIALPLSRLQVSRISSCRSDKIEILWSLISFS
jgi:hypothetical protein